jgi:hypothetical protein
MPLPGSEDAQNLAHKRCNGCLDIAGQNGSARALHSPLSHRLGGLLGLSRLDCIRKRKIICRGSSSSGFLLRNQVKSTIDTNSARLLSTKRQLASIETTKSNHSHFDRKAFPWVSCTKL